MRKVILIGGELLSMKQVRVPRIENLYPTSDISLREFIEIIVFIGIPFSALFAFLISL